MTSSISIAPSVVFAIGTMYQRRNETAPSRVVGALLGSLASGETHVTQCFVVPHSEVRDQISINTEYYKNRMELHKKCYGKSSAILGWFSITQDATPVNEKATAFINDSFGREVAAAGLSPFSILLSLNISANGKLERKLSVTDISNRAQLASVPCSVDFMSNDAFAVASIAAKVEQTPEESIFCIGTEVEYITQRLAELREQVDLLKKAQAQCKEAGNADLLAAIERELSKVPESLSKSERVLAQDAAGLLQVCTSIGDQLEILDQLITYQA